MYIHCLCSSDIVISTSSNSILLASRNLTTSCCFFFIATKPEEEAMNTRMTILWPRRDALSAAADSGLARTRRQNSAENRGRHRAQRSLRVRSRRSGSLPPGPQLKAQRLPAAGRGSGERGGGGSWVRGMMGNVVSVAPWSGWLPELIQVASNYCVSVPFAHRWLEGSGRQGKACNKRW